MAGPTMGDFIAAAGESLIDAQSGLTEDAVRARMAVSEARLDARVALDATGEQIRLQTISLADINSGAVESSALSTVRLDFVAVAGEAEGGGTPPQRNRTDVIGELAGRADVNTLDKILGGLTYEATYVSDQRRWVVIARAGDEIVRESIISDTEG